MRALSSLGRVVHVLHDEKIELFNDLVEFALVNPGVRRICPNDPEALDFSLCDSLDNLVEGPTVLGRNLFNAYSKESRDLFAIGRIQKIMAAQQVCRIRKEAGTHRVALAGDRICSGTRSANVTRHQGKIDNRLRRASGFVPLIYSHGPPEGNAFAGVNRLGELSELQDG